MTRPRQLAVAVAAVVMLQQPWQASSWVVGLVVAREPVMQPQAVVYTPSKGLLYASCGASCGARKADNCAPSPHACSVLPLCFPQRLKDSILWDLQQAFYDKEHIKVQYNTHMNEAQYQPQCIPWHLRRGVTRWSPTL